MSLEEGLKTFKKPNTFKFSFILVSLTKNVTWEKEFEGISGDSTGIARRLKGVSGGLRGVLENTRGVSRGFRDVSGGIKNLN